MKTLLPFLFFIAVALAGNAQAKQPDVSIPDSSKKVQVVDLSCGECKFHLKGKSCDLAVRINGKAYFLDGANIDSFGDAHASDGFCNAIRKAEVQGQVVKNRFKVRYIKLLP